MRGSSTGSEGFADLSTGFADAVILNGKIVTVDEDFTIAEGMAIKDDRIIRVGSNAEVSLTVNAGTRLINAAGRTVIPGIIDAHMHPELASLSELDEEIPAVRTIDELLHWIKREAELKSGNEWVVLPKFFFTRLQELRYPTLEELDEAAPATPVFLNGSFGGMVNSTAMRISELKEYPNGILRRSVFKQLNIPSGKIWSGEEKAWALAAMLKRYNRYGITSICSGAGSLKTYQIYQDLKNKNELTCRVFQNIRLPLDLRQTPGVEQILEEFGQLKFRTGNGDDRLRVGALKIILDGGILTGTAYLREPWGQRAKEIFGFDDPDYRGVVNYSFDDLVRIISAAAEAGWKFAAHCTGGGGVDLLLDAFEKVNESIPLTQKRYAIIHGNFFTPGSISRMKELGIYADMQAAWLYKDGDALMHILGPERTDTFLPYRSLLNKGVMINGGSDHMVKFDADASVNPYNPFLAMWSMITRKTENGNVINESEGLSREDVLRIYTINNAFASFEESFKGSIEVGKLADIAVLTHDILTCPADQIKDIESVLTLVGGKAVHARGGLNYLM